MGAPDVTDKFEARFGVRHLAHLRDGSDFTGRARRVARRLGDARDAADRELYAAHGGRAAVLARLMPKWRDRGHALRALTGAEERLMLCLTIENALVAPTVVERVDERLGFGLFAAADLRAGEVIGEYTGVLRPYRPADADNGYLAQTPAYGRVDGLIIDGRDEGNVTRFINHGVAGANVINHFVFHQRRWHRVLRADRDVAAGSQLLTDYGEDYWRDRARPVEL